MAAPPPAAAADCALSGRVVDRDGRPVAGARVSLVGGDQTAVAGGDGGFCLAGVAPGRRELVAVADGYSLGGGRIAVEEGMPARVEMVLPPAFGEEIVVTGTRTRQRLAEVPIHVQVMGREELDAVAARTLADAIEWTPGLRVESNCQNCNTSQVRMLGLEGAYSQILVDGQPTVSSLALVYGLEQLPARLIESIEVVKGGGSAIYGAGALAGAINLIPHEPSRTGGVIETRVSETGGEPGYSLSAGADWTGPEGRTAATVYGQLDRVGAADVDGDGFSEVTRRRLEALGLRLQRYALDGRGRLAAELNHIHEDRRGGDLANLDLPPHRAAITEEILTDRLAASVSWLHTLGSRFDYRLTASLADTDRRSYYGAGFDPDAYGTTANPLWLADAQLNRYRERGTLTAGVQYTRDDVEDLQLGYGRVIRDSYRSAGVFVQDDRKLGSKWSLLYGVRLDDHSAVGGLIASPRAALMWTPLSRLTLRASLARGFRPPVVFDEDLHIELVGGGDTQVVRNAADLEEESSLASALSLEWRPELDGEKQALLELHLFHTRIDDLFHSAEDDDPATPEIEFTKTNFGTARVAGVELSGALRWGAVLSVEAGWVEQSARFEEPEPDFGSREFFRTPERYGTALVTWSPRRLVDVFLGLRYTGPMKAPHYAGFIPEDRLETTRSFWTLDLNAARPIALGAGSNRSLTVTAGAKNLTDAYQEDLDRGPDRDASYVYGPRLPRTWFVGLKLEL